MNNEARTGRQTDGTKTLAKNACQDGKKDSWKGQFWRRMNIAWGKQPGLIGNSKRTNYEQSEGKTARQIRIFEQEQHEETGIRHGMLGKRTVNDKRDGNFYSSRP